jgi:hypothetical protein
LTLVPAGVSIFQTVPVMCALTSVATVLSSSDDAPPATAGATLGAQHGKH